MSTHVLSRLLPRHDGTSLGAVRRLQSLTSAHGARISTLRSSRVACHQLTSCLGVKYAPRALKSSPPARDARSIVVGTKGAFSTSAVLRAQQKHEDQGEANVEAKKPILEQTTELKNQLKSGLTKSMNHENIYTVPNILTFTRLIAAPAVGYLILHDQHFWAASLFFYAGVTDLVDGWVARKWKLQTVVGSVIDPMADKLLMTILTICLAIKGALPIWLATLILGRDASLAIAAIYYRFASLPPPKTLARYWNFSLPSAEVHPTDISKYNTFLQLVLIGATTMLPVAGPAVDAFLANVTSGSLGINGAMTAAQYIVATTTVWSGASYLYTKNAVKILGATSHEDKMRILTRGRLIIAASFLGCAGLATALEYR